MDPKDGLSIRGYARHRGVSQTAVQKAIRSGRLRASLGEHAGQRCIKDVARADREWEENRSKPTLVPRPARSTPPPIADPPAPPKELAYVPLDEEAAPVKGRRSSREPGEPRQMTLIDAQQIVTIERGRKLRMENALMRRKLIERSTVVKEAFEAERIIRETILNLPVRIAGELAAESDATRVSLRLDAALREALNMAADALLATVNG